MAKSDDIKKQLAKQQKDVYGDEAPGGHMQGLDTDDNAEEAIADFIGNEPGELNIADEIENDEEDLAGLEPFASDMPAEVIPDADARLERADEATPIDYLEEDRSALKKDK